MKDAILEIICNFKTVKKKKFVFVFFQSRNSTG